MLLAVECSAAAASCCLYEDGKIIALSFVNLPLTHSQTLLPAIENMLLSAKKNISDVDSFAVAAGPGSFTGVRIGVAAVKGLAAAKNTPCAAVSSLYAAAWLLYFERAIVCPVMDARRGQVYNALFRCGGGSPVRLCEDRAISVEQLKSELLSLREPVIITGDGSYLFSGIFSDDIRPAPRHLLYQSAAGVAFAAENGEFVPPGRLLPIYLRKPQAEREYIEKRKGNL